jgi:hypothetical protein
MILALPEGDLFGLGSPITGEIRGERSLMAFPLFRTQQDYLDKAACLHDPGCSIEVRPRTRGVATIYDKEIVLSTSPGWSRPNSRRACRSRKTSFSPRMTCSASSSPTIPRAVTLGSPLRWSGCRVRWNMCARVTERSALKAAKVRLCDRLFRAIFRDRRMLEYAATYLQSGRIERRI